MPRSFPLVTLWLIVALAFPVLAQEPPGDADHPSQISRPAEAGPVLKYAPGEVLVRFKTGVPRGMVQLAHSALGAQVVAQFALVDDLQMVRLPASVSVEEAIATYQKNPDVLYAEPNYARELLVNPNDTSFGTLWGLHNTGQNSGTVDADIDAPEAWDLSTGSSTVVVAGIDTGMDYNHLDLAPNMFRNEADCNTNGVDNDGNGYVDDCYGIDTGDGDSNPADTITQVGGHGSHTAGTMGAKGNNSLGVTGVNWTVKLMACKAFILIPFFNIVTAFDSALIGCLNYVAVMKDRGVPVIATNNSWGGGPSSQAMLDAIDAHRQRGILFITSSGNGGSDQNDDNNDTLPVFPANYYVPNLISVTATSRTDTKGSFANFGRHTVHLGAPGVSILSTTPGNNYATMDGTSMAAPHVTGAAALLKAHNPARDWKAIKNLLLAGGDTIASVSNTITRKRLNLFGAMTCSDSTIFSRLQPSRDSSTAGSGSSSMLAALHINCATPNGAVDVSVAPGGEIITLLDDGTGGDPEPGDGIYSGQWVPPTTGSFTLTFPGGDVATVQVLSSYGPPSSAFNYRVIAGTNLNLGDDTSAQITSPFAIQFGDGSFTNLFVSSNGNINFSGAFTQLSNAALPTTLIGTLVAPFWDDLEPIAATDQNVFWEVTGAEPNRKLIVEWRNVRGSGCGTDSAATVKFQVVFFENNSDILFNYADTAFGGAGGCNSRDRGALATVGVQVATTLATQFSLNTSSLSDNTGLSWELPDGSPNPLPALASLSPASATPGGPGFTLTVNGSNFLRGSKVKWNGSDRTTTFVNSGQLTAAIRVTDIAAAGIFPVTVFNSAPGGGTSNALDFAAANSFIKGKVKDANKAIVAGATIEARQGGVTKSSTTGAANGTYSLGVAADTYDLVASQAGFLDTVKTGVTVGNNQTLSKVNFKLYHQSFFQGTVTDKVSGAPLAGALVEAVRGGTVVASNTSTADGSYSLPVIKGTYTVRASLTGYKTKNKANQAVGDGATKNLNLTLTPL